MIPGIEQILKEAGVRNNRHFELWEEIKMKPLVEKEAEKLLALLPDAARAIAARDFPKIERHSKMRPRHIQRLADRLWHAHHAGADAARLAALIARADSYE